MSWDDQDPDQMSDSVMGDFEPVPSELITSGYKAKHHCPFCSQAGSLDLICVRCDHSPYCSSSGSCHNVSLNEQGQIVHDEDCDSCEDCDCATADDDEKCAYCDHKGTCMISQEQCWGISHCDCSEDELKLCSECEHAEVCELVKENCVTDFHWVDLAPF